MRMCAALRPGRRAAAPAGSRSVQVLVPATARGGACRIRRAAAAACRSAAVRGWWQPGPPAERCDGSRADGSGAAVEPGAAVLLHADGFIFHNHTSQPSALCTRVKVASRLTMPVVVQVLLGDPRHSWWLTTFVELLVLSQWCVFRKHCTVATHPGSSWKAPIKLMCLLACPENAGYIIWPGSFAPQVREELQGHSTVAPSPVLHLPLHCVYPV